MDEFDNYAENVKEVHDYVAVCRQKHGFEQLFHIPFEKEEDLTRFMKDNDGDVHKIGFYAKAFVKGEPRGENT